MNNATRTIFSNLQAALHSTNYRELQRALKAYRATSLNASCPVTIKLTRSRSHLMAATRAVLEYWLDVPSVPQPEPIRSHPVTWVDAYHIIAQSNSPKRTWRQLCFASHPDHGGTTQLFHLVQDAWAHYKAA